jgi:hypothetical protein
MRAVLMVVANVRREQSLEMAFIHRDNVVRQVSSAAFDPTLRHTVLPGTLEGRAERCPSPECYPARKPLKSATFKKMKIGLKTAECRFW